LRNKHELPLASNAYNNVAIGSSAQYYPAGIHLICSGYCTNLRPDEDIILLEDHSGQGTYPVYQMPGNGWDEQNRCNDLGFTIDNIWFPKSWIIPANGGNNSLAVLMPDGHTIKQNQPITNCTVNGHLTSRWIDDQIDIYGTNVYGAHGGSGLSGAAFAIKKGEFTAGIIRHVIGVNLDAHVYYNSNCSYHYPAKQSDGYCPNGYGGSNPYFKPGARLALLPTFNLNNLRTQPGRILGRAFIDYGLVVGDDTTWNDWALWSEQDNTGSVVGEFSQLWPDLDGFSLNENHQSDPFYLDMVDMMSALYIVINDGPSSMGGGGTPRVPALPAIGN